jgi:hypothetical protein
MKEVTKEVMFFTENILIFLDKALKYVSLKSIVVC